MTQFSGSNGAEESQAGQELRASPFGGSAQPLLDTVTLSQLDRLHLQSARRTSSTMQGKRRAQTLGSSLEFADYRPYVPGDDVRRIDWNVYQRSQRPFVRTFWDEQEMNVHLLVDRTASMRFGGKLRHALQLAAAVGYVALGHEDRVTAAFFSDTVTEQLPVVRGKGSMFRLFDFLEGMDATNHEAVADVLVSTDDMARAFRTPGGLPRHKGQTWLFTDGLFRSGFAETLLNLSAARQEVHLVHILAPAELAPTLSGELRLLDVERGTAKQIALSERVLRRYDHVLTDFRTQLQTLCGEHGANYHFVRADAPVIQNIFQLLM
jgi:uncharacterized protein (DUF58 family)